MPRPRATSTVTHGPLKFRPVEDRGTKQDGMGRTLRYWRGREHGKAVRKAHPSLWAAQDDLPQIAARYARGETEAAPSGTATAEDFRETATAGMILQAWVTFRVEEESRSLKPRSIELCQRYIAATKDLPFRKVRAAAVGKPHLDALTRDLRPRWSTRTTKDVLKNVAQAWRWAYERGYVPRPLDIRSQVGRLAEEARKSPERAGVRKKQTPSIAQAQEVGRWFLRERPGRGTWGSVAYLVTLAVGNRRGALQHLRWDDLRPGTDDNAPGIAHIPVSKTGPRDVYVSTPVLRQILALRPPGVGDSDPLLLVPAGPGGGWKAAAPTSIADLVNRWISRACRELRIPAFSVQGLRRLAAQERARWAVRNGGSLAAAAAQSGHTLQTFMVYYEEVREEEVKASSAATDYALVPPKDDGNVVPMRRRAVKRRAGS